MYFCGDPPSHVTVFFALEMDVFARVWLPRKEGREGDGVWLHMGNEREVLYAASRDV